MNPSEFTLSSSIPARRSSRAQTKPTPMEVDSESEESESEEEEVVDEPIAEEDEEEVEEDDDVVIVDQQQQSSTMEEGGGGGGDAGQQRSRKEIDNERKDLELGELLEMMEDWKPIIPDEVTDYYLQRSGFETSDIRVKRLLALAAQRFVSSISSDAYQYARTRTIAGPIGQRNKDGTLITASNSGHSSSAKAKERAKTVLTMGDLEAALDEYGINAGRANYYL